MTQAANKLGLPPEVVELLTSTVRRNLMTVPGYRPYCGGDKCHLRNPRAEWSPDLGQFRCACGWVSGFPDDFIAVYRTFRVNSQICQKCGVTVGENKAKYCGDGSDKDNAHRWVTPSYPDIGAFGLDRAAPGAGYTAISILDTSDGTIHQHPSTKKGDSNVTVRQITMHKIDDLNKELALTCEKLPGENGDCYRIYAGELDTFDAFIDPARAHRLSQACVSIKFQNGDPATVGLNGITNEVLLAILRDRLEIFQRSPNACPENAEALENLQRASHALGLRAQRMKARRKNSVPIDDLYEILRPRVPNVDIMTNDARLRQGYYWIRPWKSEDKWICTYTRLRDDIARAVSEVGVAAYIERLRKHDESLRMPHVE